MINLSHGPWNNHCFGNLAMSCGPCSARVSTSNSPPSLMRLIFVTWPRVCATSLTRFGGRRGPAVPAARRRAGQGSLQVVEEEPLLQAAGGLQDLLARVPQDVPAKPDLWVSPPLCSSFIIYFFSMFPILMQAEEAAALRKQPDPPWVLHKRVSSAYQNSSTSAFFCRYSVELSLLWGLCKAPALLQYTPSHPANPCGVSECRRWR